MNKAILILWGLVAAAVLLIAGYFLFFAEEQQQPCPGDMNTAPGTQIGGAFEAIDHNGHLVTETDIITGPTLMYFGYTFCPDICPLDTARNARVTEILAKNGIDLTPVFVSVDPERDTPEVMSEFVKYTHPKMIGITGSNEQINHLKDLYKAYGERAEGDDPEYYLVNHSSFSYLMSPQGLVAIYERVLTEEQIAENIQCHINRGDL